MCSNSIACLRSNSALVSYKYLSKAEKRSQNYIFRDLFVGDRGIQTLDLTDSNRTLPQLSYALLTLLGTVRKFPPVLNFSTGGKLLLFKTYRMEINLFKRMLTQRFLSKHPYSADGKSPGPILTCLSIREFSLQRENRFYIMKGERPEWFGEREDERWILSVPNAEKG